MHAATPQPQRMVVGSMAVREKKTIKYQKQVDIAGIHSGGLIKSSAFVFSYLKRGTKHPQFVNHINQSRCRLLPV